MNSQKSVERSRFVRGRSSSNSEGLSQAGTVGQHSRSILGVINGAGSRGLGGTGGSRIAADPVPWEASAEDQLRLHLLVVDEDAGTRSACAEIGQRMGFEVLQAADAATAQGMVRNQKVDLMLMDLKTPAPGLGQGSGTGLTLLEEVKKRHPEVSVIAMTAAGTVASAVAAMRMGAEDYVTKPFALEDLVMILERASHRTQLNVESRMLRERLRSQRGSGPLIGRSPEMEKLYRILSKVAHSTHPVLILGEGGTGKELVARSIHFNGPSASMPFRPVDCGAFGAQQLEAQLFGYIKGAGPARAGGNDDAGSDGLLASREGGTVFLKQIGELPMELQAKLLRALQEKMVRPVGAAHTLPISRRVLASSNTDLAAMVEQGKFRRDLYFRLNVVSLRIPPLRLRKADLPELVQFFLERVRRESGKTQEVSDEMLRFISAYDWPDNVRELENAIIRASAMSSGGVIRISDLPSPLRSTAEVLLEEPAEGAGLDAAREVSTSGIQSIAEMEKKAILGTVRQLRGDKLLAAKLLGIGKTTLYRKLKEYGTEEVWE